MDIHEALASGPRTSKELQALTGWSQAKVSNVVRQSKTVLQLPGRRPYSYATVKPAFGSTKIPVTTTDTHGKDIPRGLLQALEPNGYLLTPLPGASLVLAGESQSGHFEFLPYFMDDARPQGFLGRLIAERLSEQSDDFTKEPDKWSEEMVGRYLVANGDDLPGDFVFGFPMMHRLRKAPQRNQRDAYPRIAEETLEGFTGGSSAGGEQQKFTTFVSDIESHVIVKFSPSQGDLTAQRWRDILVTEYQALTSLTDAGFPTADTEIFDLEGRIFLESKRFDRRGKFGRSSMLSLRIIDAEFVGSGGSWTEAFEGLLKLNLASYFDAMIVKELELFGRLINNTDMHLGNLSMAIDGDMFSLLPAYDMCSMGFAPKGSEIVDFSFDLPELNHNEILEHKQTRVLQAAANFWAAIERDPMTSAQLRNFAATKNFSQRLLDLISLLESQK